MKRKVALLRSFGLVGLALALAHANAQDTLRLTTPKAEELFLKNNLSLLAAQYNISANEALIQQAKAWDNPVLSTEQNLYDGKFFRHTKGTADNPQGYGQWYASLSQVIRTANKRGLQVQLAQDGVKTAQAQLNDLLRNLRYVLQVDMNNLAQLQAAQQLLETEISHTQTLAKGMDEMLKVGDISLKDNVRLKALLYSLQSDYADNLRQQQDLQKELHTLLHDETAAPINATIPSPDFSSLNNLPLLAIVDSAKALRPDAALASAQALYQQHNLAFQKALAKPDLTVGVDYDRASNYIPNYVGLQIGLPLPIFNKNRGNIQSAEWSVKAAQATQKNTQSVVQAEVLNSYNKLQTLFQVQKSVGGAWAENYERLMRNMVESYEQRKVTLFDFIDFFTSYKDTRLKQLQQTTNLLNAAAEFNFVSAQNIIPLK
ncbi:TolC family protein [Flavisolibacter ginsenosidimutans]|uniref:TolC family protein n=1 Tax=Flavisolibacter ginsenosidimutans TaxID=661481 RepID=A0A5B8UK17_9BACT|nr:TolC family protein [Flavisolibacter ginsenosidimutans]QEC56903.1 TolC family protein [Flavisolibacter ginsenosidimutans]